MTYFTLALLEEQPKLLKLLLTETFLNNKYYNVQKPMTHAHMSNDIRRHSVTNARRQIGSLSFGRFGD